MVTHLAESRIVPVPPDIAFTATMPMPLERIFVARRPAPSGQGHP
jgi:hypothetical protein